ncbi:hypothetical protein ThrDRAFT_02497 [Frankia casuarinae]|nr:hypothetical protein CcI6DRAFT_04061 [Frankia sp. CcI6]EYT91852.1 hypothetical protein ThrDRAFT_02497 [Frankia casuarinae]KEZ34869.1 hypothetical protein CEDDRAFT_03799 [Frankia sp. CeD]KFB03254.1 hypothetical protein ALLO2DRAFT_04022 [Frankia sp. Allo2]OAA21188.1 hypothetical protein AAY23_108132 [Frankia casuarinae]
MTARSFASGGAFPPRRPSAGRPAEVPDAPVPLEILMIPIVSRWVACYGAQDLETINRPVTDVPRATRS